MESYFTENNLEYDNGECILRRELAASGKSRAFINDTPASLTQMKELGEMLIDVHSQHQNLLLNKEDFQLNVLDILANDAKELAHYRTLFHDYKQACRELDKLTTEAEKNRADEDYLRFQLEQLEECDLKSSEQEELEDEANRLTHAEELKAGLYKVPYVMYGDDGNGIVSGMKEVQSQLQSMLRILLATEELSERVNSSYIELKDIAAEIESLFEEVEFNPTRFDFVNERLNQIYSLQQKHHVKSVDELLALADDLQARLAAITSYDERITALTAQKEKLQQTVVTEAGKLTKLRTRAARHIEQEMQERLIPLGMPNVRFRIELTERHEPDASGMDSINFLFSANKNGALQSVASVASGGEIARVMLSIKAMIAGAVKLPTIIFDEIDTGVSGKIAEKMAHIMQEMGERNRQVISITHLPQIAALGGHHYRVYKEDDENGTTSHLCRLDERERVEEIAHMLSGETLSEAAISNAKELLRKEQ